MVAYLKGVVGLFSSFVIRILGTNMNRNIEDLRSYVSQINVEFEKLKCLTNDQLRAETVTLRKEIMSVVTSCKNDLDEINKQTGNVRLTNKGLAVDSADKMQDVKDSNRKRLDSALMKALPKAFAIMKETACRFTNNTYVDVIATDFDRLCTERCSYVTLNGDSAVWNTTWDVMGNSTKWNMVYFDEQLMGGIVLHQGKIAEMATGEGKTLVSTLPIFLNALTGMGVHMVTVNDYLAKRDCAWMKPLLEFHGLSVSCLDDTRANSEERRMAYAADVVYGTNNEFGFDYLRDNMVTSKEEVVQRDHYYSIVDEVDSILIDDARTPLIISSSVEDSNVQDYVKFQPYVKDLYDMQSKIVNGFLVTAKKKLGENVDDEYGRVALFIAYRGLPKYKPLVRYLSEPGIKLILEKTENIYLENNCKRMPEIDKELLFSIEERYKDVELTDKGISVLSQKCGDTDFFVLHDVNELMYSINESDSTYEEKQTAKKNVFDGFLIKSKRIHVVKQLLKAYALFEKEVDYVVVNGQVLIVDEQTGRILDGRRYSEGLHQALEAKEMVKVRETTQTSATITLQNYFRLYDKLSGMTGTAETEAVEFDDIYKLDVVSIPTHVPVIREDKDDLVFKTAKAKFSAIVDEIVNISKVGRPVLVGTTSVDVSEMLSRMLMLRKIKHQVLNAKYNQKEAEIVSHAGESGAITVATNMAGRGTDIKLDAKSRELGGLAIIGTERHDSRRVDRQLRGRAGRQGDPGSSQFFISYEDNLMRMTIGNSAAQKLLDRITDDNEVLQGGLITKSIERAQKKIEENHYGYRKRLLEYDDVVNKQRSMIYKRRMDALNGKVDSTVNSLLFMRIAKYIADSCYDDTGDLVKMRSMLSDVVCGHIDEKFMNDASDVVAVQKGVFNELCTLYNRRIKSLGESICKYVIVSGSNCVDVISVGMGLRISIPDDIISKISNGEQDVSIHVGNCVMGQVESNVTVTFIDKYWQKHLVAIDDLKQSVQNAYYEQRDPLLVFKFESFDLFSVMVNELNMSIVKCLFSCEVVNHDGKQGVSNMNDIMDINHDMLNQIKKKMNVLMH